MATDPFDVFLSPPEEPDEPPVLKAFTGRFPLRTYRYLEEMAEHADLSRNAMLVQLVEWGITHALGRLPDEMRDEIGLAVDGEAFHQMKGF